MTTGRTLLKLAGISVSVVLLAGAYFFLTTSDVVGPLIDEPVTIVLTEDGFHPRDVSIKKGTPVTFASETGSTFWPASNQHPSHGEYPSFDPQRPLEPDESWTFTFDASGVWNYHDHLHAVHRGTIRVVGEDGSTKVACLEETADGSTFKAKCWEEEMRDAIAKGGIAAAFTRFRTYLKDDPLFQANCHDVTHIVGDAAYSAYADSGALSHVEETSMCGYGFYHGFIERMLQERGSYDESRSYCASLESDPGFVSPTAAHNAAAGCRHGIGHGILDSMDGSLWGDGLAMAEEGVRECEMIFSEEKERVSCVSGIANALAIAYNNRYYDLSFETEDAFHTCEQLSGRYHPVCFSEIGIHYVNEQSLPAMDAVTLFRERVPADAFGTVLQAYLADIVQHRKHGFDTPEDVYGICISKPAQGAETACVRGAFEGWYKSNPADVVVTYGIRTCDFFENREVRAACADELLGVLEVMVSKEQLTTYCQDIQDDFGLSCTLKSEAKP